MENKFEGLLSFCSEIDFGTVNISAGEKEFCCELNQEVISLCKSLPESTQTDALLFLMRYFRIPLGQELSIFTNYYVPAWSIVYWLIQSDPEVGRLEKNDLQNAKSAHSMALLLHPLDDHLNDGELEATHLALLVRSQAWMIMNEVLRPLTVGIDGGEDIVQGFLDDYYSSICGREEIQSLDSYCNLFRMQMATWLIVPILVTKKIFPGKGFSDAVQTAYESFGIAWRLLDDINDIQTDMMKGVHSSIYCFLPENLKDYWDKDREEEPDPKNGYCKIILDYILENSVIEILVERICDELNSAAYSADGCNMKSWADEFRRLLRPLKTAGLNYEG